MLCKTSIHKKQGKLALGTQCLLWERNVALGSNFALGEIILLWE